FVKPVSVTKPSSLSVFVFSEHSLWLPRFWDSLNFKKDREFVGITILFLDEKQDYNHVNSSGMTYQQLKLIITSVMDSSLPWIALTTVSGKKKILLLKKDRENPVLLSHLPICFFMRHFRTLHSKRNSRWKLIFLEAPRLQDRIGRYMLVGG
ncbi:LOW QUALITY PROTEIN: hypothetical protein HID58_072237, partial [Brassica napus]